MVRRRKKKRSRSIGEMLFILFLVNIVPIGVAIVLWVKYQKGEITFEQVPEGWTRNLIVVGVAFLALILVASVSLPMAHEGLKGLRGRIARRRAILAGSQEGSRGASLLSLPVLYLFAFLVGLFRTVLILGSLALIAVVVVFIARLKWPEFGQSAIDWIMANARLLLERIRS